MREGKGKKKERRRRGRGEEEEWGGVAHTYQEEVAF